jgi:tetratricopeptide (TPR) repeat protein
VSYRLSGPSLGVAAFFFCAAAVIAQNPVSPPPSPHDKPSPAVLAASPDYSKEAFVFQKLITKVAFANDGTFTSDTMAEVRIQSQAGVQNFSLLTFSYASANAVIDIPYVRVRKPDGTVVVTPAENVQDMPADVTRQAPFYSDIREKQVAVKALDSGDLLEYEFRIQVQKPLIPGQFWYSYDFFKTGIVLQEDLQISVPLDRYVNVQSPDLKPTVSNQARNKVYTWSTANLQSEPPDQNQNPLMVEEPPPPAVLLTTFHSWDEVGQWFHALEQPQVVPTAQIHAKADELSRGAANEMDKLHAIYNYVSLKIRYVGIAFGLGRYQPHAAADVLSNEYGDCKDKQTLLTSLLAAEGIKSFAVLVNSSRKIDPAVPSPGQFDHVIAAVPQGKDFIWLDTTAEVAPFGFLPANLRDEESLLIPDGAPAQVVRTPAAAPFKNSFVYQMNGALSDAGTLQAAAKAGFRGDAEYLLRSAFRRTPQTQWKTVVQSISYSWNFAGDVSNTSVSSPDDTNSPLQITYDYTRENYSNWANKQITPPLPLISLPDLDDKAKAAAKPIKLGSANDISTEATVELPKAYTLTPPSAVNLIEDFAEYHASYSFSNGTLHAERRLITKMPELPWARHEDYEKFANSVRDDENAFITLSSPNSPASAHQPTPEAQKLYQAGTEAWQQRDINGALDDFQRTVTLDPQYGPGWTSLGMAHLSSQNPDQGFDEMKKAISVDPGQTWGYTTLASIQMAMRRPEDALQTWKQLEKADPQNADAPANAGRILISLKRYSEAVPELEIAVKRNPSHADLFESLGLAYTRTNSSDEATAAFSQALKLDSSPMMLNDVAFSLADANLSLEEATRDAQSAVQQEEDSTSKISIDTLSYPDLQHMPELSAFWDTLGWVHFRTGHLDQAEKYIAAAWSLQQQPDLADHLGQVYEKEGKIHQAVELYAFALAIHPRFTILPRPSQPASRVLIAPPGPADEMSDTRKRLVALLKGSSRADEAVSKAQDDLTGLRSVRLPKITNESATAEFFVLFAKGPKVAAVKFLSGSETLRNAGKSLAAAKFDVVFPDDGQTLLIRRGVLNCEPELSYCQFILYPPDSVHSIN